jgi:uncharacterized protein
MTDDPVIGAARVVETHISLLFFVEDRVYKIHKPVRFGFLDFTDRAAREEDCRREVELNRRLAPDVYLGVADITMDQVPIDHMVVMRALPADRRLSTLVSKGADAADWIDRTAARLASFHAGADRSEAISVAGSARAVNGNWESNFAEVARFVGLVIDPVAEAEIQATARSWLARNENLLESRVRDGHVCDGHGDLQADDVFCLDDGVRILDCLEFSDALRHGDVSADVAFLVMDLERLGHEKAADQFVAAYENYAGTTLPRPLLHHYMGLRAYVRAKVACLQHEQGVPGAEDKARALHELALRHLRRSRRVLVLVGGLPGSGKSTLASGLSAATGWALLRSDQIRRSIGNVGKEPYAPEAVTAVYEKLVGEARDSLDEGQGVILDASWVDAAHRSLAVRAATETGSDLVQLRCSCRDAVAESRILARQADGVDASEATATVRNLLASRADPWPEALVVDTSDRRPAESLASALAALTRVEPRAGTLVPLARHVPP